MVVGFYTLTQWEKFMLVSERGDNCVCETTNTREVICWSYICIRHNTIYNASSHPALLYTQHLARQHLRSLFVSENWNTDESESVCIADDVTRILRLWYSELYAVYRRYLILYTRTEIQYSTPYNESCGSLLDGKLNFYFYFILLKQKALGVARRELPPGLLSSHNVSYADEDEEDFDTEPRSHRAARHLRWHHCEAPEDGEEINKIDNDHVPQP